MNPATILTMIQAVRLGMEVIEAAQSGQLTPEEVQARWQTVVARAQGANDLWESAGKANPSG